MVIGNVPFGAYKVNDRQYEKYNFFIHDYFLAKSLDHLRPGGVTALITTKGTMDKASPEVIQREFGLSKAAFKRAVGHLMKEKQVVIRDGKIWTAEKAK